MIFAKYNFPLPNNGEKYDLSLTELVEILDKVYDNGFEHARDIYDISRQPVVTTSKTINWDQYQSNEWDKYIPNLNEEITDIECPKCGKNIKRDISAVLTTYPPQYRYFCSCGWQGTK